MPSKYVTRSFLAGGYYHAFDRGNNKEKIFHDESDYNYFLSLISHYLNPTSKNQKVNFYNDITILSYCLIPNHFHLMFKQTKERSISLFMQVIIQRYTTYYNKKYGHINHVFRAKYGSRLIENTEDLISVSKYVHKNAEDCGADIIKYKYSSAQWYIQGHSPYSWLDIKTLPEVLFGYFGVAKENFPKQYEIYLRS
ncbi:MAG: transposase [Candidatus Kerfeldbacteria bacterium]|nr:transposase [Candidatus Kerfeldbacteria bacterium]